MLRQVLMRSRLSGPVAALAAGVVALSCGGGAERQTVAGPAPVALQPTAADDGGSVSEADKPQTTLLCHYDATTGTSKDLNVPAPAVEAHLKHGDRLGSCTPACPCFTAGHGTLTCGAGGGQLGSSCGAAYSLSIGCTGGSQTLLEFRSVTGTECYFFAADAVGNVIVDGPPVAGLTDAQVAACKQFIVTSTYYKPPLPSSPNPSPTPCP